MRSRLTDIADQTVITAGSSAAQSAPEPSDGYVSAEVPAESRRVESFSEKHAEALSPKETAQEAARRRWFLARLGEFRRSRVLVPMGSAPGPDGGAEAPLTVDAGGVRWILAFTGETALARYAAARGEGARAWRYRGVWGAALLDAAVPTVAESGVPCGVLVNAADGEQGLVLPPVVGTVPDGVAVNGVAVNGVAVNGVATDGVAADEVAADGREGR